VSWIRTTEALASYVDSLAGTHALALDSESDSLHHYFEKVCLLQLKGERGEAVLVDTLAGVDLAPLAPLIADPSVVKVLHGADYDVTTLKRDFGFAFAGVFDTMIAARFLGRREIGLQALVRDELGIELSKGNQKDDWSERPLSAKQEAYARADVEHLLELHARVTAQLAAIGRLDWVLEECAAVEQLEAARKKRDPDAYLRVKGAERLDGRGLAVLRELYAWREARAAAADVPSFKVIDNDTLLALAARAPASLDEARAAVARYPRVRKDGEAVLIAHQRAAAVAEADLPEIPRPSYRARPSGAVARRVDQLKAWRAEEAERARLDVSIVLPQRLVDRVAEAAPRSLAELETIEGLRRWRVAAFGPALLVG
jgi:ribonuclease D